MEGFGKPVLFGGKWLGFLVENKDTGKDRLVVLKEDGVQYVEATLRHPKDYDDQGAGNTYYAP